MAGISIHVGSTAFGLAAIGSIAKAYADSPGDWLEKFRGIPGQLWSSGTGLTDTGKAFAIGTGGYVAMKAVRGSIEKKPMLEAGKLRVYLL